MRSPIKATGTMQAWCQWCSGLEGVGIEGLSGGVLCGNRGETHGQWWPDGQAGCLDSSHLEIRVGLSTSKAMVSGDKAPVGSQLTYKSDEPKMGVAFGRLYHVLAWDHCHTFMNAAWMNWPHSVAAPLLRSGRNLGIGRQGCRTQLNTMNHSGWCDVQDPTTRD